MAKDGKDEKTPSWSATSKPYTKSPDEENEQPLTTASVRKESRTHYFDATPMESTFGEQLNRLATAQEESNKYAQRREEQERKNKAQEKEEKEEKKAADIEAQNQEYAEMNVRYCEEFIKATMAVSTLGASGCFVTVVAQIQNPAYTDPHNHHIRHDVRFNKETVRLFIALAWMSFIFALALAVFSSMLLNSQRRKIHESFKRKSKVHTHASLLLTLFMEILQLGAFCCLGLVISAYRPYVGWCVVSLTAVFFLLALFFWNMRRREVLRCDKILEEMEEEDEKKAKNKIKKAVRIVTSRVNGV